MNKKEYASPEFEVVRLSLRDVILGSIIEGDIPIEIDDPVLPGDDVELELP